MSLAMRASIRIDSNVRCASSFTEGIATGSGGASTCFGITGALAGALLHGEPGFEAAALQTRIIYAAPNRQTRHRRADLTRPVASSMRAPGEAVGGQPVDVRRQVGAVARRVAVAGDAVVDHVEVDGRRVNIT